MSQQVRLIILASTTQRRTVINQVEADLDVHEAATDPHGAKAYTDTQVTKTVIDGLGINATQVGGFAATSLLKTTDLIDEDDMSSDDATKVPSQQSVKAYVDSNSGSGRSIVTTPNNHNAAGSITPARRASDQTDYYTIASNVTAWNPVNMQDGDIASFIIKGNGGSNDYTMDLSALSAAGPTPLGSSINIFPDSEYLLVLRKSGTTVWAENFKAMRAGTSAAAPVTPVDFTLRSSATGFSSTVTATLDTTPNAGEFLICVVSMAVCK